MFASWSTKKLALDFMIDSGASDVRIPSDVVSTLRRTCTLTKYSAQIFRLHSLRVGDRVVNNVIAHAVRPEGFLFLGQSFLTKFKSWSIDNNRGLLVLDGEPAGPLGSLWPAVDRMGAAPD
jgi:predicted aspartyl protease